MGDVIQFIKRESKEPNNHILQLDIYGYDHGDVNGHIKGSISSEFLCYEYPKDRLNMVEFLQEMIWMMQKENPDDDPDRGELLAVAHVYEGSTTVRIDDERINTEAHFDWLDGSFEHAKKAARETEDTCKPTVI